MTTKIITKANIYIYPSPYNKMEFEAKVIKKGNSLGVIIPKKLVKEKNIKNKEKLSFLVIKS